MITISLILIYILNLIDYWQTMYVVRLCGIGAELNPIGRFLLENNCGWVVKLIVAPILLATMGIIIRTERKWSWAAYFMLILYALVVSSNFIQISRI